MNTLVRILNNLPVIFYFVFLIFPALVSLAVFPIILFQEIYTVTSSGFANSTKNFELLAIMGGFGFFIGLSLIVPKLRKMYYFFPWLFPYLTIMYINGLIFTVAILILNYGYEVQNSVRHTQFFILMIAQMIVCRLAMCFYFYKRPVKFVGGSHE